MYGLPDGNPVNFLDKFTELLISTVLEFTSFLVLNDFNLHKDNARDTMVFDLMAHMESSLDPNI